MTTKKLHKTMKWVCFLAISIMLMIPTVWGVSASSPSSERPTVTIEENTIVADIPVGHLADCLQSYNLNPEAWNDLLPQTIKDADDVFVHCGDETYKVWNGNVSWIPDQCFKAVKYILPDVKDQICTIQEDGIEGNEVIIHLPDIVIDDPDTTYSLKIRLTGNPQELSCVVENLGKALSRISVEECKKDTNQTEINVTIQAGEQITALINRLLNKVADEDEDNLPARILLGAFDMDANEVSFYVSYLEDEEQTEAIKEAVTELLPLKLANRVNQMIDQLAGGDGYDGISVETIQAYLALCQDEPTLAEMYRDGTFTYSVDFDKIAERVNTIVDTTDSGILNRLLAMLANIDAGTILTINLRVPDVYRVDVMGWNYENGISYKQTGDNITSFLTGDADAFIREYTLFLPKGTNLSEALTILLGKNSAEKLIWNGVRLADTDGLMPDENVTLLPATSRWEFKEWKSAEDHTWQTTAVVYTPEGRRPQIDFAPTEIPGYEIKWSDKATDSVYQAVYSPQTWTVTFLNEDGSIYKVVSYKYGDTSIAEPAVPKKEGYTGKWEAYQLNTQKNTEVSPIYAPIKSDDPPDNPDNPDDPDDPDDHPDDPDDSDTPDAPDKQPNQTKVTWIVLVAVGGVAIVAIFILPQKKTKIQ